MFRVPLQNHGRLPEHSHPTSARPLPRIVVLTKRHRLSTFLVDQLSEDGTLAGVIYEERFRTIPETLAYLRRNAKREGRLHTLDVVAYEIWDRLFRRNAFDRTASRLLPTSFAQPDAQGQPEVHKVDNLNSAEAHTIIDALRPDLLVVHACGILSERTFSRARVAALNIHCGVLPQYRGHASTFWSMYKGDVGNIGVTVHRVARTVDTGQPLGTARIEMTSTDDDISMWIRAFKQGVEIVRDAATTLARNESLQFTPYVGETGPHYVRRGLTQHLDFVLRVLPRLRSSAGGNPKRAAAPPL